MVRVLNSTKEEEKKRGQKVPTQKKKIQKGRRLVAKATGERFGEDVSALVSFLSFLPNVALERF